jgi:hypothetical protein
MTNSFGYIFMLALVLLALLPAIFACNPSLDGQPGCQIDSSQKEAPDQVSHMNVYTGVNYEGNAFGFYPGDVLLDLATSWGLKSLYTHKNCEVVLFERGDLTGASVVLSGQIPDLSRYLFSERTRSILYRRKTMESPSLPRLFVESNFMGKDFILPFGMSVIPEGDVLFGGSIMVPDGLRVTVTTLHGARFKYDVKNVFTSDISTIPSIRDPIVSVLVELK